MTNIREVFAANLKKFRQARGWSQAFLAEKVNASPNYIGNLENTLKFPSSAMIEKLASALGIDPTDLFSRENNPMVAMKIYRKAALEDISGLLESIINDKIQKLDEEIEESEKK